MGPATSLGDVGRPHLCPAASIGDHCIIERDTIVADSIVYSGTYVGERLSLHGVVVDRSKLINTSLDAEIDGGNHPLQEILTQKTIAKPSKKA